MPNSKHPKRAQPKTSTPDLNAPPTFDGASRAFPSRIASGAAGNAAFNGGSALLQNPGANLTPSVQSGAFNVSIVPRLRVGAALLAMQRAENDPFKSSSAGHALLLPGNETRVLGSSTSLDYDVNSWLSVRAQSSRRDLTNAPNISPLLRKPVFR